MLTFFACGPFYEIWRPRKVHSYALFCTVLLAIKEAAPTNMVQPGPMCIVKTATLSNRQSTLETSDGRFFDLIRFRPLVEGSVLMVPFPPCVARPLFLFLGLSWVLSFFKSLAGFYHPSFLKSKSKLSQIWFWFYTHKQNQEPGLRLSSLTQIF